MHCAAGIHRTGMMAAMILRYLGHSDEEMRRLIRECRGITADDAGEHRIGFSSYFVEIFGTIDAPSEPSLIEARKASYADVVESKYMRVKARGSGNGKGKKGEVSGTKNAWKKDRQKAKRHPSEH
jgi:hypothetical protein